MVLGTFENVNLIIETDIYFYLSFLSFSFVLQYEQNYLVLSTSEISDEIWHYI